jgi:potassium-dependent mechanosensitive channel
MAERSGGACKRANIPGGYQLRRKIFLLSMKLITLLTIFIFTLCKLQAQDTQAIRHPAQKSDTGRDISRRPAQRAIEKTYRQEHKRIEYFRDTTKRERTKFDSNLFTNNHVASIGDYAEQLGRVYQVLSQIQNETESFVKIAPIQETMGKEDTILEVIQTRMSQSDRTFNLRNLQMFSTLLNEIEENTARNSEVINKYDTILIKARTRIAALHKDTLMINIFRDTSLSHSFQPQLLLLNTKWRQVDSLVIDNEKLINTLTSQSMAQAISIKELSNRVEIELKAVGTKAFSQEVPYLWERQVPRHEYSAEDLKANFETENQLARFYFSTMGSTRTWLVILGILFFFWIWRNYRTLSKLNKLDAITRFEFKYIGSRPVACTLIFVLCLAPLFDLHAPAVYIETIQLLLMIALTIIFRNRLPRPFFISWCVVIALFFIFPVTRIFDFPPTIQRWAHLVVDIAAIALGIFFVGRYRKQFGKLIFSAIALYVFLNALAVICNLFGRVTFTHIFSNTAVYSFTETVGLCIFVQVIVESFLLQIETSRIRKKYPGVFEYQPIEKSVFRAAAVVAVFLWTVVLTTNLNLLDVLANLLTGFFSKPRQVGSFSFTIGGALLFFGIIWLANFLQKYVAYFFGDIGDEVVIQDKGQRSRLMISRLILLVAGFLVAVAASGLPVDRITVILGALGVGVGLGLQNIVNNFVSGIILIFDRPLRIGDTVDIGDKRGRVKQIGIRSSTLVTEEGADIIIPNGDVLSQKIVNWTLDDNYVRQDLTLTLDRSPDKNIDPEAIKEIIKKNPNVVTTRDPEIFMNTINSKTIELKIYYWNKDFGNMVPALAEIRTAVHKYLEDKGISFNSA